MAEQKRELQMNEEKLLIAQAEDLIHRCGIQDIPVCSGFLDARQQSLLRRQFGTKHGDVTIVYYGGYEDADRVVMACLPFYLSEFSDLSGSAASDDHGSPAGRMTYFDDVLTVIRAHVPERSAAGRSGRSLAHSDYLGALMGLGIDRSVIGDILVRDDGSWSFDGLVDIEEFKETIGVRDLPDEDRVGYQTLAGFILSYRGAIPSIGDNFDWNGFHFEIADMDGLRIDRVIVSRIERQTEN